MNFLFQVLPLDVLPVNYLLNASFFKRLVIIIFVDPFVTEKCLQQMILHRPVDFTTALANNKTLSPLIILRDVNSSLCCYSTTHLNPSLIAANSLTPKGSGHQHLRLRIKRPQVAIVFQRCLLQRSISRINDCSPRKMLLSAERFVVAHSVLKRFSR